MKTLTIFLILALTTVLPAAAEDQACEMLFVQNAGSMSFDGSRLILKEADPNIIFFCDRPVRTAGHMNREVFMKLVSEGENSFAENPPNAAVSVIDSKGNVTEVVVTLIERPAEDGNNLTFPVKVLDGDLPKKGQTVIMFIDPIGRPMSPTSVAGVHRRHHRRAVRHIVH